jgi:hypothetical protein
MTISKLKWSDVVAIYGMASPLQNDIDRTKATAKGHIHKPNPGKPRRIAHQFGCDPPPRNRKLKGLLK